MSANSYIQLWRCLLNNSEYADLSLEAVVCYCVLLDRYRLSEVTGYRDNQGCLYVTYSQESLGKILRCKRKKAANVLRELEGCRLIHRRHQGMNKADAIYVHTLPVFSTGTSESSYLGRCDVPAEDTSNTDSSNTVINNDIDQTEVCAALMRVWEYDYVINHGEDLVGVVDAIINVAVDILCSSEDYMHIAGKNRSIKDIHDAIAKLTSVHIIFIARRIKDKQQKIKNMDSYIATALYNSGINVPG